MGRRREQWKRWGQAAGAAGLALAVGTLPAWGAAPPERTSSTVAAQPRPETVLAGDWTGDGKMDFLVLNRTSDTFTLGAVHLLRGQGDGTFSAPERLLAGLPGLLPRGGAVGDVDQDGRPDLVVQSAAATEEGILIFLNSGLGSGTAAETLPPGFAPVLADLNGDNFPDLACLTSAVTETGAAGAVKVYLNLGGLGANWAGFGAGQTYDSTFDPGPVNVRTGDTLVAADLDGDGDLDLAADTVTLVNQGGANFTRTLLSQVLAPAPLAALDIEADGVAEVVQGTLAGEGELTPRPATLKVYRWNSVAGSWAEAGSLGLGELAAFTLWPEAGHYSGSPRPDLLLGGGSELVLVLNQGGGVLEKITLQKEAGKLAFTGAPELADVDGDGDLDLLAPLAGTQIEPRSLIHVELAQAAPIRVRAVAFFDRDRDGVFDSEEANDPNVVENGLLGMTLRKVDPSTLATVEEKVTARVDFDGDQQIDPSRESGVVEFIGLKVGNHRFSGVLPGAGFAWTGATAETGGVDRFLEPGDSPTLAFGVSPVGSGAGVLELGDLPNSSAAFLTGAMRGPVHLKAEGVDLKMGRLLDFDEGALDEFDVGADGDDRSSTDDEDGVVFLTPWIEGQPFSLQILNSGGAGFANLFADLDNSGAMSTDEWLVVNQPLLPEGPTTLTYLTNGSGTLRNSVYLRVRVSPQPLESEIDAVLGGETEDYLFRGLDFGDAPEMVTGTPTLVFTGYPVSLGHNGAWHALVNTVFLGSAVLGSGDGNPAPAAEGDVVEAGAEEENGVRWQSSLRPGSAAEVEITFSHQGFLSAWIDFNRDQDWDDAGEQILADSFLNKVPRRQTLAINVPSGAAAGMTFARFRFSSQMGLTPRGPALDGEVEDYRVEILPSGASLLGDILDQADDLGDGWRVVRWFGVYRYFPSGWIYHGELGPVYLASAGPDGLFAYIPGLGWTFTRKDLYPYFHSYALGHSVYFWRQGSLPARWFYLFETGNPRWVNYPLN